MTQLKLAAGQTARYTDVLSGLSGRVVIDEVLDDRGTWRTTQFRYAVRFEGDDQVFVTDAAHLREVAG